MRALLLILTLIARPEQARTDVISDANTLLAQINPINIAVTGLTQLEHLRSVIEMAPAIKRCCSPT